VEKLQTHRITLTLPVLNHGATVVFLVAGSDKATIVKKVLGAEAVAPLPPAARIRPVDGRLLWLITQDAAAGLVRSTERPQ
jgi:6-phosphogluconolactonase